MDTINRRIIKPRWETIAVLVLPLFLSLGMAILYITTQMFGLHAGDSGDLVAASYLWGIPHPPGYPFYTFLSAVIVSLFPFGTVAWRVGLMSSIPMAASLYFLWKTARYVTKDILWSSIGVILYGILFPVWLHAIGQEVFGLFALFSSVILYLSILWFEEKKPWQLLLLSFFFGLSLTHHHLIVLSIASFFAILYQNRKHYGQHVKKYWLYCLLFFCLGFVPYIYAPIVSSLRTSLEPGNASTIPGFINLVTRASYGTFRATANLSVSLIDRLLNIYTLFQFSLRDFTLIGWIGIISGVFFLRKNNERLYFFLIINCFLWIFYYFYAGFPLLINYHMGTVERFVIVPYQLFTLFFIVGLVNIHRYIKSKCITFPLGVYIGTAVFPIIIVGWFAYSTSFSIPVFQYLHTTRAMEQLGADLDKSIPEDSIVFLSADTTIYAFNYYYYVLQKRPDIVFIRLPSLFDSSYREKIVTRYPTLVIPPYDATKTRGEYVSELFSKNLQHHSFVTDAPLDWLSGVWVPHGLLYVYAPSDASVAPLPIVEEKNIYLWSQFSSDPQLRIYQQRLLLLSDIVRVYSQKRLAFALYMAEHNGSEEAITDAFTKGLSEEISVIPESYVKVIYALLDQKNCTLPQQLLERVYTKWGSDHVVLLGYHQFVEVCKTNDETILARDAEYHARNQSDDPLSN